MAPLSLIAAEGFGLGLSAGPYCAAACGPVLLPYLMGFGAADWAKNLKLFARFLGGRLAAYMAAAALAFLLGFAGESGPAWISPAATLCAGLYLAATLFLQSRNCCGCASRHFAGATPFALGFFTGASPCPPLIAGVTRAAALQSPAAAAVYFAGFFLASAVFTAPVLLATPFLSSRRAAAIGKMTLVLVSVWLIFNGLKGLFRF